MTIDHRTHDAAMVRLVDSRRTGPRRRHVEGEPEAVTQDSRVIEPLSGREMAAHAH
jgi:hypothetical protein